MIERIGSDPEVVLNLDTFRTTSRRLGAGSDADTTAVSAVTAVTAVTL